MQTFGCWFIIFLLYTANNSIKYYACSLKLQKKKLQKKLRQQDAVSVTYKINGWLLSHLIKMMICHIFLQISIATLQPPATTAQNRA